MTPYVVAFLDLTVARDHERLPATAANPCDSVTVLALPTGSANPKLHFGSGDGIPLLSNLQVFEPSPPERDGVFITNAVGAGGTLILLVTFRKQRMTRPPIARPIRVVPVKRRRR